MTQAPANSVKGNLSNQTAGRKRKGENIFDLAYGQLANSIIGDEIDGPEPSISPKKIRRGDPLSKLTTGVSERGRHPNSEIDKADDNLKGRVKRAIERRARILQEIKTISQLPNAVPLPNATVQLHNAAVPLSHAETFYAAVQLSRPAVQIKLPFPFVRDSIPERFNYSGDHDHWNYMGREIFTELLDAINKLQTTGWRGYLFYGTIGYGKSHLLAALTCYLTSNRPRMTRSNANYTPH